MKILILNWRSIKDPWVGGAEKATFEHAKRWVSKHGAEVDWISPGYDFKTSHEIIEGVKFVYAGFPLGRSVIKLLGSFPIFYFLVFWIYTKKYRGRVDVVIDQVHGIPFLTPLYVKEKIVVFVHEVGGEIWDMMYPFLVNKIGKFFERFLYKFYKNRDIVTVSECTKKDLIELGLPAENIKVVYNGVSVPVLECVPEKYPDFTMIFLNRLVKMKGVERAIRVFKYVKESYPAARFVVVGRAESGYMEKIHNYCFREGVHNDIEFTGYVSEERKIEILSKAHVLLNTSYKEGWGLVNLEANACGVPVVAFSVKGNIESVNDGVNGYLVPNNDVKLMADRVLQARHNSGLCKSCLEHSKKFSWDTLADKFYALL